MKELSHEFTDRKISPWGGLKYFHKTYVTSGIKDVMAGVPWPERGSNRGYDPLDIVEGFMTSVVLGARRLEHSGMLRTDEVVREIFGWRKGMASASTFSRFFGKFTKEMNRDIFPQIMRETLKQVPMRYMTLDMDASVFTRYGDQEGAELGYNQRNKGRKSHHPLMAFCDERKMVVNAWMRSGNTNSATDAIEFLKETFTIVTPEEVGLVRADSGFSTDNIMSYLEDLPKPVNYLFRARMTPGLKKLIPYISQWQSFESGIKGCQYADIQFQAQGWKKSRRVVLVRKLNNDTPSEQKELFAEFENLKNYEYTGYMTNMTESVTVVHARYNQRGESENRIKELKYDFGMDGFALQKFTGMEAAFRLVMVAYNIMLIFKRAIMKGDAVKRMATVRFQCIAIGSYLTNSGRKKILKLSAEGKRRHFLELLFEKLEVIEPPYRFSNA